LRLPACLEGGKVDSVSIAPGERQAPFVPNQQPARIHVVDDDASIGRALERLLRIEGYDVVTHTSAESFLASYDPDVHGCVILDVSMPGLDGLALQHSLATQGRHPAIIFLTGLADVPLCASAMREGAVDFLTKPVGEEVLLSAIARALSVDLRQRCVVARRAHVETLMASLTRREHEVLQHVMNGRLNKQIAADLGTAEKTVKVHRARAMEKMQVRSVAELVRLVERALLSPEPA
jgi:FixJ family two-component response regulator